MNARSARSCSALLFALAATGCNLVLGLSAPTQEKDGSVSDTPPDAGPFTVKVVVGGTAFNTLDLGTVTSDPAGISCPGTCSMTFPAGTQVKLFATASSNVNIASTGLSGGGCNHEIGDTPCVISPTGDVTVYSRYWSTQNIIFVSSTQKHPGAWDSVANIDAECTRLADEAGLPNPPYRAWISTSTQSADQRIRAFSTVAGPPGVWLRVDGKQFTNKLDDLDAGKVFFSPRLDEFGNDVGESAVVVTDTLPNGAASGGTHCSDWASESGSAVLSGEPTGGTGRWTAGDQVNCNADAHVYCMNGATSQNFGTAVPVNAVFIFVSQGTFTPGSGFGAADTLCANEASSASLPGFANALITKGNASVKEAYASFGFADPPFRTDGFQIQATMDDLFNGAPLFVTPNVTAARAYIDVPVWTGGGSFDVRNTDCANWMQSSGFGTSKNASSTRGAAFASQTTCAAPQHVLCFAGQVFMAKPKH